MDRSEEAEALRRHLVEAHGLDARDEALAEATMVALERRHLREHFTAWRRFESDGYWRELVPPVARP